MRFYSIDTKIILHAQINKYNVVQRLKTKIHMILLIQVEDAFHKVQHPFKMEVSKKQRIKTTCLNKQTSATTTLLITEEAMKSFP